MKTILNDFLLMIQFFTRIPVNLELKCEKSNFKRAAFFLPIVGILIGGIQFLVSIIFKSYIPIRINVVIVLSLGIIITGALHLDGFADVFDGFFSLKDKLKIIEVMKDSRVGTFGAAAIILNLFLKLEGLSYLFKYDFYFPLILIPMLGKNSILFLCLSNKTAKKNGSGNIFIGNMSKILVILSTAISIIICTYFIGIIKALSLIAIILIAMYFYYLLCVKKIDGFTGDTLGAANEITELVVIIALCAMVKLAV